MTEAELLEAARNLAPTIGAAALHMDAQRRLTPEVLAGLTDSGLFAMLVPRSLRGSELSLPWFARVIEQVATADGSTAFCLAHACGASTVAAFLPEPVARAVFDAPGANLANGPGFGGRALSVPGGFRVTGRWGFASGSHHATWLGGGCTVCDEDGTPRPREDGSPEQYFMVFPASEAVLSDTWHVIGLRGTGSDQVEVQDLFVPSDRAVPEPRQHPREPGPLYVFGYPVVYSVAFAAVGLGIARGALEGFVQLAASRGRRTRSDSLRDNPVVQAQVAQAEAVLGAARSFLLTTLAEAWDTAYTVGSVPLDLRVRIRLATTFAIQQACSVVDMPYRVAGGASVFTGNPLEQRFRDIHALSQQAQANQDHFETAGRFLLGLEPGDPRL